MSADEPGSLRPLAFIVAAELLAMTLWFSASAVVPELTQAWDLSDGAAAWLTVSVQLGFVVGALGLATTGLADRFRADRLFAVCAFGGAACTAAIAWADVGAAGAIALRFATGVLLAGVYPPGMKLAASWSTRARGLAIGCLVGALTVGSALPHLLRALAPEDGSAGLPPWRTVILVSAGLACAGGVLVLACVRPGPHLARSAPFRWRYAFSGYRERPLLLANLGYLGHMWELYAVWTWVPVFLLEAFAEGGASARSARFVAFSVIAIGCLGSVSAGFLADRFGRTRVAAASLVTSGACCLLAGVAAPSLPLLTVLCLVWGFAVIADSAQFSASISELADPRYVGTALAMQTSVGFLVTWITIQAVPVIADAHGWTLALAFLAPGPLLGALSMVWLSRLPEARKLAGGRG